MLYSVIIPVYNRPNEINELLESLTHQTEKNFEVLIIEDGSTERCEHIVEQYSDSLNIQYFYKENSGQGFSRNYGFSKAKGDYYVVFDSDCLIPKHYFETVSNFLSNHDIDCWGGPDRAHPTFSPIQKAISYSMTSMLTTGGMRGRAQSITEYHPRSFNMGISKDVFAQTGGYKITRMGEDIEFSLRIVKNGFKTAFIEDAFVYHKRRTNFAQFYNQLFFFGRARVNIKRFYPNQLSFIHLMPVFFTLGIPASLLLMLLKIPILSLAVFLYPLFGIMLFFGAYMSEKNIHVAVLSVCAGFIQLTAYGLGLMSEMWTEMSRKT